MLYVTFTKCRNKTIRMDGQLIDNNILDVIDCFMEKNWIYNLHHSSSELQYNNKDFINLHKQKRYKKI